MSLVFMAIAAAARLALDLGAHVLVVQLPVLPRVRTSWLLVLVHRHSAMPFADRIQDQKLASPLIGFVFSVHQTCWDVK